MSWLKELFSLFVDDGSLATAVAVWIALVAFVFPLFLSHEIQMGLWVVGLGTLVIENIVRSARKKRRISK